MISKIEHDLMSSLALNIANLIMHLEAQMIGRLTGTTPDPDEIEPPEHFCAKGHKEEVEELIIRLEDCCLTVKVGVKPPDYALDRHVEEFIHELQSGDPNGV